MRQLKRKKKKLTERKNQTKHQEIKAVTGQRSSPESHFAINTKLYLVQKHLKQDHYKLKYKSYTHQSVAYSKRKPIKQFLLF